MVAYGPRMISVVVHGAPRGGDKGGIDLNERGCLRAHSRESKFVQLVARRGRLAWWLAGVVFVLFYALVLAVAFAPSVIGLRCHGGFDADRGVAGGLFEFVFFWLLTAYYVRKANNDFDVLTIEIIKDALATEVVKEAA